LWLFSCACVKFSENDEERVPDVDDWRTNIFLRYPSEANEAGHFRTSSKVHEELDKKIQHATLKTVSTPMSTTTVLDLNENGEAIDQREYRSMIDSLFYLMAIWPNIQFIVWMCAFFQAFPTHFTSASRSMDF
jgi:hypothetical protein